MQLAANKASTQPLVPAPMFGNNGAHTWNMLGGEDIAVNHAVLPDGKVLLAGGGYDIGCNCMHIALVKLDTLCGKLDASFGNNGTIAHIFDGRSTLRNMVVLPNGKILACGQNAPDNSLSQQVGAVYRFNADGTADLTMNGTGWRSDRFDALSSGIHNAIIPLNGGRFYAVGTSGANINGGAFGLGLMRYLENGALDASYGGDGKAWTNLGGQPYQPTVHEALLLADSSVLVIASAAPVFGQPREMMLVRFDPNGNLFAGYGNNGVVFTGVPVYEGVPQNRAALLTDGSVLVGCTGTASGFKFVTFRVLADGTVDQSYGTNGLSEVDPGAGNEFAYGLHVDADGTSYQMGNLNNQVSYIVKRDAQGQPVSSFGTGGVLTVPQLIADMGIRGGVALNNGRVLLYGRADAENMVALKLTSEPSLGLFADLGPDTGFCPGQSVELNAGSPGSSYQWFRGTVALGSTQSIDVNTAGTYRVTITDPQGCTDRDTVLVSAFAAPNVPVIMQLGDLLYTFSTDDLQWYLNGEPIPGANSEELSVEENGTYTVVATNGETGCTATSPPFVLLNVGVNEVVEGSASASLVPNPVDHSSKLQFKLPYTQNVEVSISDALGRVVMTNRRIGQFGKGTHNVEFSEIMLLKPGSYHLVLHLDGGHLPVRFIR